MKFNTQKSGLDALFQKYKVILLHIFWSTPGIKMGSGKAWSRCNEELPEGETISRASVIFFLNDMVDDGVFSFDDATGKGGHHRVYYPILTEKEFWEQLAAEVMNVIINACGDPDVFAVAGAKVEFKAGYPICANCAVSVAYGRLEYGERVSLKEEFPTVVSREKAGFEHPRGEYLCKECDEDIGEHEDDLTIPDLKVE